MLGGVGAGEGDLPGYPIRFLYRLWRLNSPKGTRLLAIPSVHSGLGQRVEVTGLPVGPRARELGWSREAAATTLVARSWVTPLGSLVHFAPSCARCYSWRCPQAGTLKCDKRKAQRRPSPWAAVPLPAAGIARGAQAPWVAVPADRDLQPVRRFGACPADREALAEGLQPCGVTTVAMESTGVYWLPLFELREARGFVAGLVAAREVHRAPGRPQSAVQDCQGLPRFHT